MSEPEPEPHTPAARLPRWVMPSLAALAVVTLASLGLAISTLGGDSTGGAGPTTSPTVSPLKDAHQDCGAWGELSDNDSTLFLDMKGKDFGSGELTYAQVSCYFRELAVPDYIVTHMNQTRALDGRQSGSWGSFEASWSYHPDDGLDILIRHVG